MPVEEAALPRNLVVDTRPTPRLLLLPLDAVLLVALVVEGELVLAMLPAVAFSKGSGISSVDEVADMLEVPVQDAVLLVPTAVLTVLVAVVVVRR
mmetsp:Transcript_58374/g.103792  ORF Transcript_58374/g.103792 Transcript_58374/m.103792 type:complete len:95 (-) Transcript_58374:626-910(-)